jgi:hypothetical protein
VLTSVEAPFITDPNSDDDQIGSPRSRCEGQSVVAWRARARRSETSNYRDR